MLLPPLTDLTAIMMSPAARPLPSPEFLAFPAGLLCPVEFFVSHKVWLLDSLLTRQAKKGLVIPDQAYVVYCILSQI